MRIKSSAAFVALLGVIWPLSGAGAGGGAVASAAPASSGCRAVMGATFLQPSFPVFAWSQARYNQELADMRAVGIRSVIDQWTVDMDATQAYYADPTTWYPKGADMVAALMAAAAPLKMGVWLGLGNVYSWQAHATDKVWLANQLYVDERVADQLSALYPGHIAGWYVSNEVDDVLLSTPAAVGPMTWFFTSLADYLHSHDGNLRVMTSPTYSGLRLSTVAFAHSVKNVLGALDVLNVQDGGGSGYIHANNISDWFQALAAALAGTRTAVWQDADMYAVTGGPADPAVLQGDLKATCGYATGRTGFSFTTQLGPADLGTTFYYNAYRTYVTGA